MSTQFKETLYNEWGQNFHIDEILFEHQTDHQHLIIFKNSMWGNVMALDGVVQTTQRDEFIYHEMMTHVPLYTFSEPRSVLIIGGGDGGILREVLKHQSIEHVTQVEIDQAVIDMSLKYFPTHSDGAFENPKVSVVIEDGLAYVNQCKQKFDVIISDSTDPIGPGEALFTSDFYRGVSHCLSDDGIFVAQNGVSFMQLDEVITSKKRLSNHFSVSTFYCAAVPTYVGGNMAFAWASNADTFKMMDLDTLNTRINKNPIKCRYYNSSIHHGSFALPQYVLNALGKS